MKERVERQNSALVRRVIDTFLTLLQDRPWDKISVSEIAKIADIGRVTFYRNFADKDDVMRRFLHQQTDRFQMETAKNPVDPDRPSEFVERMLRHMYQYRDTMDLLQRDGKMYLLEDEFDRAFSEELADQTDKYHMAFIIGGFYKLFRCWAEGGYAETPETIAALFEDGKCID